MQHDEFARKCLETVRHGWRVGVISGLCVLAAAQAGATVIDGPYTNPANAHVYWVLGHATWTDAEAEAVTLGGHLVTINDAQENDWVTRTLVAPHGDARIGLVRDPNGPFRWVNGEPLTYFNWASGEPNNASGIEFFGTIYSRVTEWGPAGAWNDGPDSYILLFGHPDGELNGIVEAVPPVEAKFHPQPDFDGDGLADLGVYTRRMGKWFMRQSSDGEEFSGGPVQWGAEAIPCPADYDGDQLADFAVFSRRTGIWRILGSRDGEEFGGGPIRWGGFGIPVPQDYDGDGQADLATFSSRCGVWCVRRSTDGQLLDGRPISWGTGKGEVPVPADYDGDGRADLAVYAPQTRCWSIRWSAVEPAIGGEFVAWGPAGIPVPADYDGDGRADLAIYVPAEGTWHIRSSRDGGMLEGGPIAWGAPAAAPVPNDYDGDGRADLAVYVARTGKWYIRKSRDGALLGGGTTVLDGIQWGTPSATPASTAYQTLRVMGMVP